MSGAGTEDADRPVQIERLRFGLHLSDDFKKSGCEIKPGLRGFT
jgi:hypothetical protein